MIVTKAPSGRFAQRDIAAKQDFRGATYEPPQTVTAQQRLELMRERSKPKPLQRLKPKYVDHASIDSAAERRREHNIDYMGTRLNVASFGMNRDRTKAVNKGRAKAGFNSKSPTHDREV